MIGIFMFTILNYFDYTISSGSFDRLYIYHLMLVKHGLQGFIRIDPAIGHELAEP